MLAALRLLLIITTCTAVFGAPKEVDDSKKETVAKAMKQEIAAKLILQENLVKTPKDAGESKKETIENAVKQETVARPISQEILLKTPKEAAESKKEPFTKVVKQGTVGKSILREILDKTLKETAESKKEFLAKTVKQETVTNQDILVKPLKESAENTKEFFAKPMKQETVVKPILQETRVKKTKLENVSNVLQQGTPTKIVKQDESLVKPQKQEMLQTAILVKAVQQGLIINRGKQKENALNKKSATSMNANNEYEVDGKLETEENLVKAELKKDSPSNKADPCSFLSDGVKQVFGTEVSKQTFKNLVSFMTFLHKVDTEELIYMKDLLKGCVSHMVDHSVVPTDVQACETISKFFQRTCSRYHWCHIGTTEVLRKAMHFIKPKLETTAFENGILLLRACSDQYYADNDSKTKENDDFILQFDNE